MHRDFRTIAPKPSATETGVAFEGVTHLDLATTLDCGQSFRWTPDSASEGVFTAVVAGESVAASLTGERLEIRGTSPGKADFWAGYFALDIDYPSLQEELRRDPTLRKCLEFAPGIRVLRQEFFETLITFMISQNNNIPRIKGIVGRLCQQFGRQVGTAPDGTPLHAFPDAATIAALTPDDLAPLRAGYRVPGILDAARRTASGELDDAALRTMPLDDARAALIRTYGVGPKIADCVLLFGLGRFESFPVDVWIRRAMAGLFPNGLPECAAGVAGIAQQYIFHYARINGL